MYGSCTFNSFKYNSTCIEEQVIIPEVVKKGHGRPRHFRKHKKQVIDIFGTKLFIKSDKLDIIGITLFPNEIFIPISGNPLSPVFAEYNFKSITTYPILVSQKISGSVKSYENKNLLIKGIYSLPTKQLYLINGKTLFISDQFLTIDGLKKFRENQESYIQGEKDITEILEVLDLLYLKELIHDREIEV